MQATNVQVKRSSFHLKVIQYNIDIRERELSMKRQNKELKEITSIPF